MRNLALITFEGAGYPIAQKLQDEGWNVIVGIIEDIKDTLVENEPPREEKEEEKKRRMENYDGILHKMKAQELVDYLKNVEDKHEWFIFADGNWCFKFTEQLRGLGFNGIFPTEEDRSFEVYRDKAKDFVEENYPDIEHQRRFEFDNIEEAIDFLEDEREIYVLKGNDENAPTIVPKSDNLQIAKEEIISALERNKEDYERDGFILELKISDSIEHTIQGVWSNGLFLYALDDIENKKKGAGNIGENTGCASNLIFWLEKNDEAVKIALPEIVNKIAQEREGIFFWDASLLISRRTGKIYFGEFCPNRPGYNCFYAELSNLENVGEWFEKVSEGINPFEDKKANFSGSVRIFSDEYEVVDNEIYSKKDIKVSYIGDENNFWPLSVKFKDGNLLASGYLEDIAVITGWGNTITELANNLYSNLIKFTLETESWTYRYRGDYTATDYFDSLVSRFIYGNHLYYEQPDFERSADEKEKIEELKNRMKMWYNNKIETERKKLQLKKEKEKKDEDKKDDFIEAFKSILEI